VGTRSRRRVADVGDPTASLYLRTGMAVIAWHDRGVKLAGILLVAACGAPQSASPKLECGDLHCSAREVCVETELTPPIRERYPNIEPYECRAEPRAVYLHSWRGRPHATVHTPMLDYDCILRHPRHEDCSVEENAMGPDQTCDEPDGHRVPC
jgi:hypothetical protein